MRMRSSGRPFIKAGTVVVSTSIRIPDETIMARASVKLAVHPYDVLEPLPPQGAGSVVDHRIQLCIRIIVEGERDDRFCMDDVFQPGSPLFANAPSTDLTGRTHGSWVIEIHRTPVK